MAKTLQTIAALSVILAGCGGSAAMPDAAISRDAARVDLGPPDDTGSAAPCPVTFAACTTLEDHTADATVAVAFNGFAYEPRCIRVHVGATVSIPGSGLHPLHNAACSPAETPLPTVMGGLQGNGDYTFTAVGNYGYFCNNHGTNAGSGMAGLIVVE